MCLFFKKKYFLLFSHLFLEMIFYIFHMQMALLFFYQSSIYSFNEAYWFLCLLSWLLYLSKFSLYIGLKLRSLRISINRLFLFFIKYVEVPISKSSIIFPFNLCSLVIGNTNIGFLKWIASRMLLNPPDVINIRTFSSDNIYFCGKKSDTYTSFSIPCNWRLIRCTPSGHTGFEWRLKRCNMTYYRCNRTSLML